MATNIEIPIHVNHDNNNVDYFQRAQWLRAAVLGANDGLITVASLMMGVGSVKKDIKPMLLAGFAGLFAGACSMAIGEFVSVHTQRDIEMAQMKRDKAMRNGGEGNDEKEQLPNPAQAAFASALAFSVGAMLPLLAAAFIREHRLRLSVVITVATSALIAFGVVGARAGGTPVVKSATRVLVGGWVAMAITFGLTRLIASNGLQM